MIEVCILFLWLLLFLLLLLLETFTLSRQLFARRRTGHVPVRRGRRGVMSDPEGDCKAKFGEEG